MTTAEKVQEREHLIDGMHYSLFVEREGDKMWGNWVCRECGLGGTASKEFADMADAFVAAKKEAELHHTRNHVD